MDIALSDIFWPSLALVLVFEGVMPFFAPKVWKRVFSEMLQLRDGQIRFFGLLCLLGGLILWWAST